ncbi:glycoside hydrolase family 57 protein [Labilibaculum sp.]|uniref:glycoside hydrolase family 57 protein n=1 Tax=Labilibaculum sp. TaxID=2060723 RepID=UPI002AA8CAFF|nr:glycoside hydrolase family 57 protein [Labilibaculum sp.]MBN2598738.1 glycoside hydrolase family 57 protein [Marinifilaceae bacterium]
MKALCLYFQIHQPLRLKRYRFFDIGNDHYYYDDYTNESIMRKIADECYLPANKIVLELLKNNKGKFKISFSITGIALDQLEQYAPEVIDTFKDLAKTGDVEFLAETYSHSLASLINKEEFVQQVTSHSDKIEALFGVRPSVFRNTEMIYSDEIGEMVSKMGYKAILTEGAKHILGWKSPNYLYCNAINPKLKVLMRNYKLSDDISFRFSSEGWKEWPLTTTKFVGWLNEMDEKEDFVNIFMDYETFGEHQKKKSGIFEFLAHLPQEVISKSKYKFATPSELASEFHPIAQAHVPNAISWADEERDLSAWLGNKLQDEAFRKLYALRDDVAAVNDDRINLDWKFLQASDHFYYMCTKFASDGDVHSYFNPYSSPYDAFINYMNVLSDFQIRLKLIKDGLALDPEELQYQISQKDELIAKYERELSELKN